MNAERRRRIEEAIEILEAVKAEEEQAFDNLPDTLQQSEKGQAIEAAVSNLDEAIASAQTAIDGE